MHKWYTQERIDIVDALESDPINGLSAVEANRRLDQYGLNELVEYGIKSIWRLLWEQLTDVMVLILLAAAIISAFIGEVQDTVVIAAIVLLNALLGLSQEYRAEQAIAALKKMAAPLVRVRREGRLLDISARELVPGDIVSLEAGNLVPADGRILESINLHVEEAALTGESEPVAKQSEPLKGENAPLGDQTNMAFMGTIVTYGRGTAIITETGMETQLGHVAEMLQSVTQESTPLQRRLNDLGKVLAWAALGIIIAVFIIGLWSSREVSMILTNGDNLFQQLLNSHDVQELFLTAISMAVAAVPEGLPAVVTIALALGAQRLLKRHSLIRKLPAVETLGSVTVICSDKTGTLTENQMTVTVLDVAGERQTIKALLENPQPLVDAELHADVQPPLRSLSLLLKAGALCNDAVLEQDADGAQRLLGDPTETALITAAAQTGQSKPQLDRRWPRIAEVPFTSERKRMTTLHRTDVSPGESDAPWRDAAHVAFTKGAVDNLMEIATHAWLGDKQVALTDTLRLRIEQANASLAQDGHRVLGVAFRPIQRVPDEDEIEALENDLTFIGLVGMLDPPRDEVKVAVEQCRTAGIRPIMITGDHPLTALHIARELDITDNDRCLTGYELAQMSLEQLEEAVDTISVYARVAPEHKLNIVNVLQKKGQIVAMTGDGVNDAPALRKAEIGVAMGITGTDVSKEAADMVLLDDNFATIVNAIEEGRAIYDNIRKFIKYTLSSNTGELLVMLVAPFLGMPLPLIPIQILWINLVTDGLPGLALAVERPEQGTMTRPPFHPKEGIFSRGLGRQIIWVGILMGVVSLGVGYWGFLSGRDLNVWRTMVFTTLTLAQMGNAVAIRSNRDSTFYIGLFSNKIMVIAVALTFAMQLGLIYVPFLQDIFKTAALSGPELGFSLAVSLVVFFAVEAEKWIRRQNNRTPSPIQSDGWHGIGV